MYFFLWEKTSFPTPSLVPLFFYVSYLTYFDFEPFTAKHSHRYGKLINVTYDFYFHISCIQPNIPYTSYTVCPRSLIDTYTGWPRSYRKYLLQITQPSQYGYAKLQYRFAVTSGSPRKYVSLVRTPHWRWHSIAHFNVLCIEVGLFIPLLKTGSILFEIKTDLFFWEHCLLPYVFRCVLRQIRVNV